MKAIIFKVPTYNIQNINQKDVRPSLLPEFNRNITVSFTNQICKSIDEATE